MMSPMRADSVTARGRWKSCVTSSARRTPKTWYARAHVSYESSPSGSATTRAAGTPRSVRYRAIDVTSSPELPCPSPETSSARMPSLICS